MKKLLIPLLILIPFSTFATEKCDPYHRISNTNYRVIEKLVVQKNKSETQTESHIFRNKAFDIASLDFWILWFLRYQDSVYFWKWILWSDGVWWCYYPKRQYILKKITAHQYTKYFSEIEEINKTNSCIWTWNTPDCISIYETGTINNWSYVVTTAMSWFTGMQWYTLLIKGKKFNYMVEGLSLPSDVEIVKWVLKSIQFFSK